MSDYEVFNTASVGEDHNDLAPLDGDTTNRKASNILAKIATAEKEQAKDAGQWSDDNPNGVGGLVTAQACTDYLP